MSSFFDRMTKLSIISSFCFLELLAANNVFNISISFDISSLFFPLIESEQIFKISLSNV